MTSEPAGTQSGSTWDEDEYLRYLSAERQLYAYTLIEFGGFSREDAEREAMSVYEYEPADKKGRGLIFHDIAWHWAMLRIHGGQYWRKKPELAEVPRSYLEFSNRLDDVSG